jgi:DNA-binding transcriptional regulator LsrR (DeoR family)
VGEQLVPQDQDHDLQAMKAAYIRAANPKMTQQQLGEKADLGNQAQVSRLLTKARDKGYLLEVFVFPPSFSPQERRIIEQSFFPRHDELENALIDRSGELADRRDGTATLKRLHIVPMPEDVASGEAHDIFGRGAAEIVAEYVDRTDTCAVAWGRTLHATLRFMRDREPRPDRPKLFMPIAGEPQNHSPNGVSPSDAAQMLAQRWGARPPALSLRGVQARIPRAVAMRDSQGIARELVAFSEAYKKIFVGNGQTRPLIERVGMVLAGIGDVNTSEEDPWFSETSDAEDDASSKVLELTLGNIGGVWLPRPDAADPTDARAKVEQMNDRWLGAQLAHFIRCSRGADIDRNRPGVVVLAVEPKKAEIILAALDLINVLVVSYPLAVELERRLLAG